MLASMVAALVLSADPCLRDEGFSLSLFAASATTRSSLASAAGQQCAREERKAMSWYAAGEVCREVGGQLVALTHQTGMVHFEARGLDEPHWIGASKSPLHGKWEWADGTIVDFDALLTLNNLAPGSIKIGTGSCLTAQYVEKRMQIATADCSTALPSLCVTAPHCPYQHLSTLSFETRLGASRSSKVTVRRDAVLVSGTRDIGLGVWETPQRYVVESPDGLGCVWRAEFETEASGLPSVTVYCGAEVEKSVVEADCTDTVMPGKGGGGIVIMGTTPPPKPKTPAPVPTGTPFAPLPQYNTTLPPIRYVEEEDSGLPVWVWPAAFCSVAFAGLFAAVGASKKRSETSSSDGSTKEKEGKEKSRKTKSKQKPAKHDAKAAATCPTCQAFDSVHATSRLREVHALMQEEIMAPLGILGTWCEHKPAENSQHHDHIHHFTLVNNFQSACLGALSTVYSRTKPRLPRNTRIHIEHGVSPQPYEAHIETSMDTEMANAYYS